MPPFAEFDVEGITYCCRRLSAAEQFALLRVLAPALPILSGIDIGMRSASISPRMIATLLQPLRGLGDEGLTAMFDVAIGACDRAGDSGGRPSLSGLLNLAAHVVQTNFARLFALKRPSFEPVPSSAKDKGFGSYGPVSLPDGEDELYRPVTAGLCRYSDLHDGSLQIHDVAKMNDILTVKSENEARLRLAAE